MRVDILKKKGKNVNEKGWVGLCGMKESAAPHARQKGEQLRSFRARLGRVKKMGVATVPFVADALSLAL